MSRNGKHQNIILATKSDRRPCITKRITSMKRVMYATFFTIQGPVTHVSAPKDKSVKSKVLRKLNKLFRKRRPAAGLANVRLLHDKASSPKVSIIPDFLSQRSRCAPPILRIYLTFTPCDLFML
jgi:hypothetical protein